MKDDNLYLAHILESVEKVITYTEGGYEYFLNDAKTQDAVIRNFEIIGEAARKVSDATRQKYPHLPWKAMIGLRNILIHTYADVDFNRVWDVIQNHLPKLRSDIKSLLNE
jgi:uncharacterized protein with HEPN domain